MSQRVNRILEFTQFKIFTKTLVSLHVGDFLIAVGQDTANGETTSVIKFLTLKDKKLV